MNDKETQVHHAIIDLYELEDADEVTACNVRVKTGLPLKDVRRAMHTLEQRGVISYGTGGVVLSADNLDYYPIEETE